MEKPRLCIIAERTNWTAKSPWTTVFCDLHEKKESGKSHAGMRLPSQMSTSTPRTRSMYEIRYGNESQCNAFSKTGICCRFWQTRIQVDPFKSLYPNPRETSEEGAAYVYMYGSDPLSPWWPGCASTFESVCVDEELPMNTIQFRLQHYNCRDQQVPLNIKSTGGAFLCIDPQAFFIKFSETFECGYLKHLVGLQCIRIKEQLRGKRITQKKAHDFPIIISRLCPGLAYYRKAVAKYLTNVQLRNQVDGSDFRE